MHQQHEPAHPHCEFRCMTGTLALTLHAAEQPHPTPRWPAGWRGGRPMATPAHRGRPPCTHSTGAHVQCVWSGAGQHNSTGRGHPASALASGRAAVHESMSAPVSHPADPTQRPTVPHTALERPHLRRADPRRPSAASTSSASTAARSLSSLSLQVGQGRLCGVDVQAGHAWQATLKAGHSPRLALTKAVPCTNHPRAWCSSHPPHPTTAHSISSHHIPLPHSPAGPRVLAGQALAHIQPAALRRVGSQLLRAAHAWAVGERHAQGAGAWHMGGAAPRATATQGSSTEAADELRRGNLASGCLLVSSRHAA